MNRFKLVFIALLFIPFFSCNQSTLKHDDSEGIILNDGQKWKVVPDMLQIIQNMEEDIASYSDTTGFDNLSESLAKNIDSLTSNCTMTGQAHDELHKWLLPFIDLVNESKEAKTVTDQTELLVRLKASYELFNTYFE
jgi:hypothetical protein